MERIEAGSVSMTQKMWEHRLSIYVQDGDVERFNQLWNGYPDFTAHMIQEFDHIASQPKTYVSKEEILASWEQMKAQLREEYGEDFI